MIDAPHDVADILAVVGDRKVKAIVLHPRPRRPRAASRPALREEVVAPIMLHPADKPLWELTHTDYLWDLDLADGLEIEVGGHDAHGAAHAGPRARVRSASTPPTSAASSPATRSSTAVPGATGRSFSDADLIKESIRAKLFALPDETVVHTGHGDDTTIGAEKADF